MSGELDKNYCDEFSELDRYFIVFAGSSLEDVSYAKVFWSSVTLQPPIESRLVSADISQRLKVACDPQDYKPLEHCLPSKGQDQYLAESYYKQRAEEKQRYLGMVKKRDEIIALLKKQRQERIKKELISFPYKPKQCDKNERPGPKIPSEQSRQDVEDVRCLK